MDYLHIKNLDKYHLDYRDRELKWCKMYFSMLNGDPEFEMVDEVNKWRFVCFVMLELQAKKPIPIDNDYLIRKGFDLKKCPISNTLQMLHNFIEVCGETVSQNKNKNKIRLDKDIDKKEKSGFRPPTPEEVSSYCKERNNHINPQSFIDYYEVGGWVRGKTKIKNWRACVRTWEKNEPKPCSICGGKGVIETDNNYGAKIIKTCSCRIIN